MNAIERICIDGRMLETDATGVATYANALLNTLQTCGHKPLVLYSKRGKAGIVGRFLSALPLGARQLQQTTPNALTACSDIFREAQIHFNLYGSPMRLRTAEAPGIMHWTYPVPLILQDWVNLYTVHDAIPLTHPHLTSIDPSRHRRLLTALFRDGGRFLTVSEASRGAIAEVMPVLAENIVVCHQGIPDTDPACGGGRDGSFFLFIGTIERRKNLARLIDAHAESGSALPLVLAGPLTSESRSIIDKAQRHAGVQLLPYQDRANLMHLLRGARALLFPSLAEGFGLPIAEAMAVGTPVLTSRGGATEEIAAGAALLVDPNDTNEMAQGIQRLSTDDALCISLSATGIRRAAHFSSSAYGARLSRLYSQLLPS